MKYFLLLITLYSISFSANSQTPEKEMLLVKEKYSPESIFFHLDKDVYIAGETIWFKAYLTQGLLPSLSSTAINIEFINDSGRVLQKKILPVIGSTAIGEFSLPLELPQANYSIRAYTQTLLNFGPDYFHEQNIQIINPNLAKAVKDTIKPLLYLMPESGNIVAGVAAVVAFKATDQFGVPISINGKLIDASGKELLEFSPKHNGMGTFVFMPEAGNKYFAEYTFDGRLFKKQLPESTNSGSILNVVLTETKTRFIINREKVINEALQPAYLLGISNNEVVFKMELPDNQTKVITGDLPLKEMPSGILQLSLFTAAHQPLAERMIFVNNEEYFLPASFNADTLSLKAFKKNVFSFTLTDTIAGTYSVAVVDAGKDLPAASRENIISRLFLQNNIKGYVHNPLYYFEAPYNFNKQKELDLVMLTSGWRRYNWDEILNKKLPAKTHQDLNYISVLLPLQSRVGKKQLANTIISAQIMSKDSVTEFLEIPLDSSSILKLTGMIFTDTATFTFHNVGHKDKALLVPDFKNISQYFTFKKTHSLPLIAGIHESNLLTMLAQQQYKHLKAARDKFLTMESITIQAAKRVNKSQIVQDRYATGLFSLNATRVHDFISNPMRIYYRNVFEYLKVNGLGVNVSGNGLDYFVNIRGARSIMRGLLPAAMFLDGFPINNQALASVPFNEIAIIKVFSSGFVGAEGGGAGGAIAVYTKKGEDRTGLDLLDRTVIKIEGFSATKDFFSPDYETQPATEKDSRTTLYWNPYLVSDGKQNKLPISFYNAEDDIKSLKVIITGMNTNGKFLYIEQALQ